MNKYQSLIYYSSIILGAGIISYFLTYLTRFISTRFNIMDKPGHLKIHSQSTPRLGGAGIFCAFVIVIIYILYGTPPLFNKTLFNITPQIQYQFISILTGGLIIFLLGLYDDLKSASSGGLSAVIKLVVLFGITLGLAKAGIMLNFPLPESINFILTLLWIVGVISAINAIDNMDGLSCGLTIIAAGTYILIAMQTKQWAWGLLASALLGANLGFLPHNFRYKKPALIFMGDGGAFFAGFILASLSIMGGWSTNPFKASLIPIIILGVPILDLIYIVIRRHRQGLTRNIKEIITYTGNDHISHRIAHFLSKKQSVIFLYLISFTLGLGAIALRNTTKTEAIFIFIQYLLIFTIFFILIGFIQKKRE
ncbi:MAG: MraY family glycosyltransferase [Planctomycetota bacterium]|nr:MraY family glycosyltransferase [Planctomycetota bacterium]